VEACGRCGQNQKSVQQWLGMLKAQGQSTLVDGEDVYHLDEGYAVVLNPFCGKHYIVLDLRVTDRTCLCDEVNVEGVNCPNRHCYPPWERTCPYCEGNFFRCRCIYKKKVN